jgi:soluble lytic murein transglycosylase
MDGAMTDIGTGGRALMSVGARPAGRLAAALAILLGCTEPTLAAAPSPAPAARPGVPAPATRPTTPPASAGLSAADEAAEAKARGDTDPAETEEGALPLAATRPVLDRPLGSAGLALALKLIASGDNAGATLAAYALPNRVDVKIVDWLIATSGDRDVPSARIADVSRRLADWPGQALLRLRYEQALARERPAPAELIKALGGTIPTSEEAAIILARAYRAAGQGTDAAAVVRGVFLRTNLSEAAERTLLGEFGDVLVPADHKARMDRLLYDGFAAAGERAAKQLDADQQAIAKAVSAVIRGQSTALRGLDALSASAKKDPLAIYSRVQTLRRANRYNDAGMLLAAAPRDPRVLVDPDAWWIERRLVSQVLAKAGNPRLAYQIAAGHSAESASLKAEAEFHAGWYALEFLREPATAMKHFAAIQQASAAPLSVSRSAYWLGRTAAAAGDKSGATAHYERGAAFPTTYYGQLSLARLARSGLSLAAPPVADAETQARFEARELVQVIQHLTSEGVTNQVNIFYRSLGSTLTDPAELALLAKLADDNGEHHLSLQIGATAAARIPEAATLAFPIAAIPSSAQTPKIERALVYAVARQESSFNVDAESSAGALGLLQLLPETARDAARQIGIAYSKERLTTDPGYNATLGAVHLGALVAEYRGSYVLALAAYNAGMGRVSAWIRTYGDPRDPKVDAVNWIERIPFTETRNYVQRVLENLAGYRARLGATAVSMETDLKRGSRS